MDQINVLIIDDEKLARMRIRELIEGEDDITIIDECKNGAEAVESIRKFSPDLIFLDVQMPGMNGFQVLDKLDKENLPIIIFVTAYDQYALKAFDVHAIDYLLKPFDDERFYEALQRAKDQYIQINNLAFKQRLVQLLSDMHDDSTTYEESSAIFGSRTNGDTPYLERLAVKTGGRIYFIKTSEISRIKAAGKYLELKVGDEEHMIRQAMNQLEAKLDPCHFLRIHRSTIINIDYIKELQHWYKTQYVVILQNGEKFISSNSYRKNLEKIVHQFS